MHNKKIMIYTTFPYWPRLETELEIADMHLDEGYDVTLLACMGELVICPENLNHNKLKCLSCTSRLKAGHKWLGKDRAKLKTLYSITGEQNKIIDEIMLQPMSKWDDLRLIQVNGDDVGEAAFNEMVSHYRDTEPVFIKKNVYFAKKLLNNALITHFSILNRLTEEKPDKLILFNGRIASYRPALRVGVSLGIVTKVFETHFTNYDRYILTDNSYPHNPSVVSKDIISAYEQSIYSEEEKKEIASNWYRERELGAINKQFLLANKQIKGLVSNDLKNDPRFKIGIFVTSEDEFVAESRSPFYKDQNDAIELLSDNMKDEKILFIVRAHPNLKGLKNAQIRGLKEICSDRNNIKYIPPESKISTYELMEICDSVMAFGSTAGIEAVFKGKPCILLAPSLYRGLGGTIEPNSHEELIKLLKESAECGHIPEKIMPSDQAMQHAATIYAFGLLESGIKLQYQKLNTFYKILWIEKNGVRSYIRPHIFYRATDFILRCIGIPGRLLRKLEYKYVSTKN